MRRLRYNVAMSLDGFIAGPAGEIDWIVEDRTIDFDALFAQFDALLMGRKTFESLGRLLPGRTTVIVSRNPLYAVDGVIVKGSLEEAIAACGADPEVFVIGGAELYREALKLAHRLYLTEIDAEFAGDAWFPKYDRASWKLTQNEHHVSGDGWGYSYATYDKG